MTKWRLRESVCAEVLDWEDSAPAAEDGRPHEGSRYDSRVLRLVKKPTLSLLDGTCELLDASEKLQQTHGVIVRLHRG